jgi:hypothetical protein
VKEEKKKKKEQGGGGAHAQGARAGVRRGGRGVKVGALRGNKPSGSSARVALRVDRTEAGRSS